jgi:hypothetical protein
VTTCVVTAPTPDSRSSRSRPSSPAAHRCWSQARCDRRVDRQAEAGHGAAPPAPAPCARPRRPPPRLSLLQGPCRAAASVCMPAHHTDCTSPGGDPHLCRGRATRLPAHVAYRPCCATHFVGTALLQKGRARRHARFWALAAQRRPLQKPQRRADLHQMHLQRRRKRLEAWRRRAVQPRVMERVGQRRASVDTRSLGVGAERTADACVSSRMKCGSPSQPPPESTPEFAQAYLFLFPFHAELGGVASE